MSKVPSLSGDRDSSWNALALQLKADVEFTNHNEGTNRSKRPGCVGDVGVCLECLGTVLTALAGTTSAPAAACSLACRA